MTRRMFGCAQHHVIAALGVERHTASKHGSKRSRPCTRRNDGAVARIGLSFGRDLVQSGRRLAKSGCAHLREPAAGRDEGVRQRADQPHRARHEGGVR